MKSSEKKTKADEKEQTPQHHPRRKQRTRKSTKKLNDKKINEQRKGKEKSPTHMEKERLERIVSFNSAKAAPSIIIRPPGKPESKPYASCIRGRPPRVPRPASRN